MTLHFADRAIAATGANSEPAFTHPISAGGAASNGPVGAPSALTSAARSAEIQARGLAAKKRIAELTAAALINSKSKYTDNKLTSLGINSTSIVESGVSHVYPQKSPAVSCQTDTPSGLALAVSDQIGPARSSTHFGVGASPLAQPVDAENHERGGSLDGLAAAVADQIASGNHARPGTLPSRQSASGSLVQSDAADPLAALAAAITEQLIAGLR